MAGQQPIRILDVELPIFSPLEGKQILDVVLIANKAIDSRLRNHRGGIVCKLEIEKTHDHVNWSFLLEVMQKMSFGQKWIKLI